MSATPKRRSTQWIFGSPASSRGIAAVEKTREAWKKRLPGKQAEFWPWCLKADQKTLLSLLAFFAALAGNEADLLSGPLALDMEDWFTPTANFFGRIGKPEIVKAIKEATGKPVAPATEKLRRSCWRSSPNAPSRIPAGCRSRCGIPMPRNR